MQQNSSGFSPHTSSPSLTNAELRYILSVEPANAESRRVSSVERSNAECRERRKKRRMEAYRESLDSFCFVTALDENTFRRMMRPMLCVLQEQEEVIEKQHVDFQGKMSDMSVDLRCQQSLNNTFTNFMSEQGFDTVEQIADELESARDHSHYKMLWEGNKRLLNSTCALLANSKKELEQLQKDYEQMKKMLESSNREIQGHCCELKKQNAILSEKYENLRCEYGSKMYANYSAEKIQEWMTDKGFSSLQELQEFQSKHEKMVEVLSEKSKQVVNLGKKYEQLKVKHESLTEEKDELHTVMSNQNVNLLRQLEKASFVINQLRKEKECLIEDKDDMYEVMAEENSVLVNKLEEAQTLINQLSTKQVTSADTDTEATTSSTNSDLLQGSKMLVTTESSKFLNSGAKCLQSELVSNYSGGEISDEKLDDYCNVTSVLRKGDNVAVVGLSEEEAVKRNTVKSFNVENSANSIVDDSSNMSCCEDKESDRDQRSYTDNTHVSFENIGVCEEHSGAEDSIGILCSEVETSEMDQIVYPHNSRVIIEQQNLQENNMVNEVIEGFEVLEEVREELVEQVCEETNVLMQLPSNESARQYNDQEEVVLSSDEFEEENDEKEKDKEATDKSEYQDTETDVFREEGRGEREVPLEIPNQDLPLERPGLQKPGDDAGRGASKMKTKRRIREEHRPRTDPPQERIDSIDSSHHISDMRNHDPLCSSKKLRPRTDPPDRLVVLKSSQESCMNTSIRHLDIPRFRKKPPDRINVNSYSTLDENCLKEPPDSSGNHSLKRIKEEPRPRKDPPTQGQRNLSGSHGLQEWKPRKDPPRTCHQEYAQYHLLKAPIWSNCTSAISTTDPYYLA